MRVLSLSYSSSCCFRVLTNLYTTKANMYNWSLLLIYAGWKKYLCIIKLRNFSLHIFSREDALLSGKHRSLDPRASRVNSLVLWVMIRRKWCGWILSRGLWLYWFEETGWKTLAWKEFNSCPPTKSPPVSLFRHDATWKPSVTHWCNVTLNFSVQVPGREDSNTKLNIWSSFFWYLFL